MGTSRVFMLIPLLSCPVDDPTGYDVQVALRPAEESGEPDDGDYMTAEWINGEIAWEPPVKWQDVFPVGEYMAFIRLVAGAEDVRLPSGRVRVGDNR